MSSTRAKGELAERLVSNQLHSWGWQILTTNYYTRYGEIDIVALEGGQLVFVEVKSLCIDSAWELEETISKRKLERLYKSVDFWLWQHEMLAADYRLDFVGAKMDTEGKIVELKHIRNL